MSTKKDLSTSENKTKVGRPRKKVEKKIEKKEEPITEIKKEDSGEEYTVNTKSFLNVRSGAGKNYGRVGSLNDGDKITVYEIKDGFGRIADGQWVCMEYLH